MAENTEEHFEESKYYRNIYTILNSFITWRPVPCNINIDYKEINSALKIIRGILSMKQ
jgi:hypothetical protein